MLKIIATAMILSVSAPCFAEKRDPIPTEQLMQMVEKYPALLHLGYGYTKLLANDVEAAVEELRQATELLDEDDRLTPVTHFLIYFGEAIAYDRLGLRDQAKQSVGSIFLLIAENDTDDDEEEDDELDEVFALFGIDEEASIKMFQDLVESAPSPDVRKLLHTITDFSLDDDN